MINERFPLKRVVHFWHSEIKESTKRDSIIDSDNNLPSKEQMVVPVAQNVTGNNNSNKDANEDIVPSVSDGCRQVQEGQEK